MKCNVGPIDRVVRLLLAVIVGSGALMLEPGWIPRILLTMAGGLTLSAVLAWCPIYAPFHFSTLRCAPATERP